MPHRPPHPWRQVVPEERPSVPFPDRLGRLRLVLLVLWVLCSFGLMSVAHRLDVHIGNWPLNFWLAAQGIVLLFVLVVVVHAVTANRREGPQAPDAGMELPGRD